MSKIKFAEVYAEYLVYAKKNMKPQTYYTFFYNFNSRILPFFKDMYLEDITSLDILNWENEILKLNYSNNYNRGLYYNLSGFFEYCKKIHGFDKTIISNVGCFKKHLEEDKHDFYTLKEFKKFIKCVDNNIYKQFFNLMFFTGTRPGEAMALKFSDLKNGYISINKTIESHGNRSLGTPKNTSSIRNIKIDRRLQKDLMKLYKYYKDQYHEDYDYYIFGGKKCLSPTTINRHKLDACNKANIRPITLHQFRHSHATLLLKCNILINEVSRRLGHSKTSTTLDIYAHTDLTQEKRVFNTLNSMRYNIFDIFFEPIKNIVSFILKHRL